MTAPRRTIRLASLAACLLVEFLSIGPIAAADRWPDERTAGVFSCHADFSLADQQPLLSEMAVLQHDMRAILGVRQSREPIHLFLFDQKTTYQAYMKQYFPRVPYRRALFIKGRGPGMVFAFRSDDFATDVRHESTHALLHASLVHVPLWLDEGLAEYFEAPRDERSANQDHLPVVQAMARTGQAPRLEELEALDDFDQMGRDEYRDAWAWIHFMLHGPREGRDELTRYLQDLQASRDVGNLSDRLRRRVPDLNRRILSHFNP
jgi:hypothetical protein